MIGKRYKLFCVGLGIGTVLSMYFTWCVSTIAYKGTLYNILHLVCTIMTLTLYIIFVRMFLTYWNNRKLYLQIRALNVYAFLFWIFISIYDILEGGNSGFLIVSDLVWIVVLSALFSLLPINIKAVWIKTIQIIKDNYGLVILLFISCVLGIYPTMYQFKWDGALYEQALRQVNLHSMSSAAIYGHISLGYAVLFCLFRAIVINPQTAMALLNIVMYLCSICAFYGIMRQLIPDIGKIKYLLATSIYAFSPYTLGMINYYSLDFATLCLFVCMMYFLIKKQWIFQFVTALLVSFTKEPTIVSYGTLCVGIVIMDFITCDNRKKIIYRPQYYFMLITGLLWGVTYLFIGGWSGGEGGFGLDFDYALDKAKVLYVLNFNWIFTVISIVGISYLMLNKKFKNMAYIWLAPIIISTICFTLFSMLFNTTNNARYVAQIPVVLYIITGYLILCILKEKYSSIILILLSGLLLVSSFLTIDPISKLCFETVDVGKVEIITTGMATPGDCMIYNKQMLGMEYALNKAVAYAVDNNYMVIMPRYEESRNSFDGLFQTMNEREYGYESDIYWSEINHKRTIYEDYNTSDLKIYTIYLYTDISMLPLDENEKHCFIYSKLLGEGKAQEIMEQYPDAVYQEYNAKGWTISMVVF